MCDLEHFEGHSFHESYLMEVQIALFIGSWQRPSNHYMSLTQSALGTQQDGRQRKFKLAVKAEKELTRLEEQFLVPNILSLIHLPFWEIFAWRVEVPFKHLKEEMQVNLMMTISMTPRELHLMYNFMTLYITVINLLVQNNVFNFLGGLKVRHSVPGDCLSVCN